jgi:uncharacterized protein YqeY
MSPLYEQLVGTMTEAIKARDNARATTLRTLKSVVDAIQKDSKETLDDGAIINILQKEAKKRHEALEMYKQSSREDLVDKEQAELDIIATFLPLQLDDAQLETIVQDAIAETGAESIKDMGKVMGIVIKKVQGKADGTRIADAVKKHLV